VKKRIAKAVLFVGACAAVATACLALAGYIYMMIHDPHVFIGIVLLIAAYVGFISLMSWADDNAK
jgi:hypothetical protein